MLYVNKKNYMEYVTVDELYEQLMKKFPGSEVLIEDTAGDSNHYYVIITSDMFGRFTLLEQHRMVYNAIGAEMMNKIHALKLKTITKY